MSCLAKTPKTFLPLVVAFGNTLTLSFGKKYHNTVAQVIDCVVHLLEDLKLANAQVAITRH